MPAPHSAGSSRASVHPDVAVEEPVASAPRAENRLLRGLPHDEAALLAPHLEPFPLRTLNLLAEAGAPLSHVYFPTHGVISVVRRMRSGTVIEAGTVGCEGFVGLGVLIGEAWSTSTLTGQIPGLSLRAPFDALHALLPRLPVLRERMHRFGLALLDQTAQTIACNSLHSVEQRCVRWLLTVHDRVGVDDFLLTHEVLSEMLAVRRAGVTEAAGVLQRAGLITYSRGHMRVRDRKGLEAAACECYGVVQAHYARLLGPFGTIPESEGGTS